HINRRTRVNQVRQKRIADNPLLARQADQRGVLEHSVVVQNQAQGEFPSELIRQARANQVIDKYPGRTRIARAQARQEIDLLEFHTRGWTKSERCLQFASIAEKRLQS